MDNWIAYSIVVAVVSVGLVAMIRRNLRQRPTSRHFRDIFIAAATDLISKPEFPDALARQLAEFAVVPGGWLTRFMVLSTAKDILFGWHTQYGPPEALSSAIQSIPAPLRAKYVTAVLALALSDSYRCALLGRVWRGFNNWVPAALGQIRPDVEAHATQSMISQVSALHVPKQYREVERRLECAV